MADSGLDVPPDRRVSRLSVGEKQRLEILKVLYRGARILVLDEPTAVLTPQEVEGLFVVLRRLAANGLSIIFISHKLNEVLAIADRVAVLRAGRKVADRPAAGADRASLAELMVGREVAQSRRTPRAPGAPLLVLNEVDGDRSARPRRAPRGLARRCTPARSSASRACPATGRARSPASSPAPWRPRPASVDARRRAARRRRRARRSRPASAAFRRIATTRASSARCRSPRTSRWRLAGTRCARGFLQFGAMRRARRTAPSATTTCAVPGPDAPIRLLSGGNIQKVILARVFERAPRVVLANQPTRGLDVGATAEVHRRLLEARERGVAIVLISEDLDELLALSDRVAVMARGRLSAPRAVETVTQEQLGLMMAGQAEAA